MQAVVLRDGQLLTDEVADPTPAPGQILGRVLACGICGSDLHAAAHLDSMIAQGEQSAHPKRSRMQAGRDVVMGHEFCVEVVDLGPDKAAHAIDGSPLAIGDRVCALPLSMATGTMHAIGYSNDHSGGFAQFMALDAGLSYRVPDQLATDLAALTEPLAVGEHAVARGDLPDDAVPLVIGCGPVGLAVIVALRRRGLGPIIAADFSPRRRQMAADIGADIVIDPAEDSPYETWAAACWPEGTDRRDPFLAAQGIVGKPSAIFECVGVPGMVAAVARGAQRDTRIVVVGVCMETDQFDPLVGISKELDLRFVLGYSPIEFGATLASIADGSLPGIELLTTGDTDLTGTPDAFAGLADPERHVKIMVKP